MAEHGPLTSRCTVWIRMESIKAFSAGTVHAIGGCRSRSAEARAKKNMHATAFIKHFRYCQGEKTKKTSTDLGVLKGRECTLKPLNRQGVLHRPRGAVTSDIGENIGLKWAKQVSSPHSFRARTGSLGNWLTCSSRVVLRQQRGQLRPVVTHSAH